MSSLLLKKLNDSENKTLEFKRDLSSPKPILKTIVAFANTAGGTIILGIDDNKDIIGINDPLGAEEKLSSLIADHICPFILPAIKIVPIGNKSVLLIEVPHILTVGPFYLKKEGENTGVMVRLGSTTRSATKEMIQELKRIRTPQSFDAAPCLQTTYKDLDQTLIKTAFKAAKQLLTKEKLQTLKILVPYGKNYIPSNAGIILFGKRKIRELFFPMSYVSCARFAGTQKVDFIDQLDIPNIIQAVDEVPAFIRRNTKMAAIINDIRRKDVPEYAPIAIREGLLNALMHADYSYSGTRIFINIFDDRLEIRNPGCLPPGMTIEGIKDGISIARNLVIARIFQIFGWVEQFGTGYFRIKKVCEKDGYSLPEWREIGLYTDIIFKPLTLEPPKNPFTVSNGDPVGTQSGPSRDPVELEEEVDIQIKILIFCKLPRFAKELRELLGRKNRSKFRNSFITPLLELKLLDMTIPEKPNSRLQQYVTTAKGLDMLTTKKSNTIRDTV